MAASRGRAAWYSAGDAHLGEGLRLDADVDRHIRLCKVSWGKLKSDIFYLCYHHGIIQGTREDLSAEVPLEFTLSISYLLKPEKPFRVKVAFALLVLSDFRVT